MRRCARLTLPQGYDNACLDQRCPIRDNASMRIIPCTLLLYGFGPEIALSSCSSPGTTEPHQWDPATTIGYFGFTKILVEIKNDL